MTHEITRVMEVKDLFGLEGKSAIVIGGGLGMGESTSLMLARAGCNVAVLDVVPENAHNVADRVKNLGRLGVPIVGNALDPEAIPALVAEAERELGSLDVMVSIVGRASFYDFLDMTLEDWTLDHDRNLRYFAFCAQAVARSFVKAGKPGAITAIASNSGIQSAPRHASYGAAKAGLINLVKTLAVELAPHGVRVNAVSPGMIETLRFEQSPHREKIAERLRQSLIPFGRGGKPDDIGNAALFLSSDLASYISGQTLCVDGGWTAAFLLGSTLDV